ncbi:MAG: hypothetical protein MUF04_06620, partial [Akkermansiaceae bacterium]|nr:hypothetical protein [Akkermansiaceae bacterium]
PPAISFFRIRIRKKSLYTTAAITVRPLADRPFPGIGHIPAISIFRICIRKNELGRMWGGVGIVVGVGVIVVGVVIVGIVIVGVVIVGVVIVGAGCPRGLGAVGGGWGWG